MKKIFIIGIMITAVLLSCNKDEKDQDDSLVKQDDLIIKELCLELVYPVSFIMPDESLITCDSREEIRPAIKAWFEAHPDYTGKPHMLFPVDAFFKGEPVTINDHQEMKRYKMACEEEKDRCFVFIYPITYIMPDESTITINSHDDHENKMAIRLWYEEHPDIVEKPHLQYPVKVKLRKDGIIKTIHNKDEMIMLKEWCKGVHKP